LYYFAFGHGFPLEVAVSCLMTVYTKLFTPSRFPPIFPIHLMGEANIYGNQWFLRVGRQATHPCEPRCLCELCVLCG
ncbi:hypothetical protein, partial [Sulfuriferula multivorans]|uniref:hypothetical protein n=1 Tax=Sulfuriferula multivorans TaxID=1559896 RepID=UPI001CB8A546